MSEVAMRLEQVRARIRRACEDSGRDPGSVALLPVSKRQPVAKIREAIAAGVTTFGENRVQELVQRAGEFKEAELAWHMVGSLQTNKTKLLLRVPGLVMLESVDRSSLVEALQQHLDGDQRLCVLLQVNVTGEEQKHGVAPDGAVALLNQIREDAPGLFAEGLMAMGPLQGDPAPVFARVQRLAEDLRQASGLPLPVLSMGMTGDMEAAIAAGSTLVRVGTGVFGERN